MPRVPECLSAQVPGCPGALSAQVLKCLSSAQVSFGCPLRTLWKPHFPLNALWVKKVCNITRNELVNSCIDFLKTFQNTYFCTTLIVFSLLGNKTYKFYHILLTRWNQSNWVSKISLNILQSFSKLHMMEARALFLVKIVALLLQL